MAVSSKDLPAFLQQSKAELHHRFVDLEWQQRSRLAQGMRGTDAAAQWARLSGDEISARNRYANINPFASNRVKLDVPEGVNDYINASPIVLHKAGGGKRYYIATQGPKQASQGHIWRMLWHECASPATIVMLTQTHESGREKCFQYFPHSLTRPTLHINDGDEFGRADSFRGTLELVDAKFDSATRATLRTMQLKIGGRAKKVRHYLFEGWPDFLTPEGENRAALLQLVKTTARGGSGTVENPCIVHCSAGVGRSGTFIALDYLLGELDAGSLDVVAKDEDPVMRTVDELRSQRMMMVQGESQYHFVYEVLREQWLERHKGGKSDAGKESNRKQNADRRR